MRCFVACFPDPDSAGRLHRAVHESLQRLDHVRLVPPENYHVTLRFLGQVDAEGVADALAAVESLGGRDTRVAVRGLGGFPRDERAHAVIARLEPAEQFGPWVGGLAGLGKSETRGFVAHVTVARVRGRITVPALGNPGALTLRLSAPALYESVSTPKGVRYRRVQGRRPACGELPGV